MADNEAQLVAGREKAGEKKNYDLIFQFENKYILLVYIVIISIIKSNQINTDD